MSMLIVFLPVLLSLIVTVLSRHGIRRVEPRVAAWSLTLAMATLAVSTAGAAVLLACPLPARLPIVAALGRWQPQSIRVESPVPVWLSAVALAGVLWLVARSVVQITRLIQELQQVGAAHRALATTGVSPLVVLDAHEPRAMAVPRTITHRGRVVVTKGLLGLLDREEQAAVISHERAHLQHGHAVFLAVARLSVALNPLLGRLHHDLEFALERWADEEAATVTEPSVIASALAKTAIAILHPTRPAPLRAAMSLEIHAVPDRIAALLTHDPFRTRLAWVLVTIATAAIASMLWSMHDTERFFETVRLWSHS